MEVYKAINAVQGDLAKIGISKDKKNAQQGYKFRGIDDVYDALSPLLAEHKLCIIPYAAFRTVAERETKAGGTLFYVTVECEFHFVSAVDGSKHIAKTFGEAMDSGDKATNKAMSAAYKYAAFMTFCIPVDAVDADAVTPPEVKPKTNKEADVPNFEPKEDTDKNVIDFQNSSKEEKIRTLTILSVKHKYTPKKEIALMTEKEEMIAFFKYLLTKEEK
jgi:hypothetical protein